MSYGFIYETTCLVTGKKYIGKRVREFSERDDEYLGSGKLLNEDIQRYGRSAFTRVILKECESKEELTEMEEYYLRDVDAMHNPDYYNLTNNSIGWPVERGMSLPDYWKQHMSESQKKRPPVSEKTREKLRKANIGKHHSEETKRKIGDATRGIPLSPKHRAKISESLTGEKNPNYGKHYTPEKSKRQSEAQKRRFSHMPQHNKGIPMTEDQKNILSKSVTKLWEDEDYRRRQSEAHSGKVWMYNQETLEKVYITKDLIGKYEDLGWKRGRGKSCKRIL